MLATKITPNFYTYSVLIKALSADPNLFKFAKVNLLDMMKKKMHPNAGTYTAVFKGFARQGTREWMREGSFWMRWRAMDLSLTRALWARYWGEEKVKWSKG